VALALPCAATLAAEDAEDAARDCESVGACAGAQGAQPLKAALAEVAHHSEGAHGASLDWLMPKSGPASAQSLDGRRGASGAAGGAPASPWLGGRVPGSLAESLKGKGEGGAGRAGRRPLGVQQKMIAADVVRSRAFIARWTGLGERLKALSSRDKEKLQEQVDMVFDELTKGKFPLTKDQMDFLDAATKRLEDELSGMEA